ncbi:MAG: transcriptional repressor [Candidatus Obscuribacterales bacterium]|nr:transcriptional repressor [Steroidobacteraceae bacterium]
MDYAIGESKARRSPHPIVNDPAANTLLDRAGVAQLLLAHGVKPTQQRVIVAEVLLAQPAHMSAEQILAAVRRAGARISKATVYNTLKALTDCKLVRQIYLDPDRSVYDSTRTDHHHFHDVESGMLWDIKPDDIAFSRLPPLPEGMETASVEVVIRVRRREPV